MTAAYGIDVSTHQESINWPLVYGAGKRFAICRSTMGTTYTDNTFRYNFDGAQDAGLKAGFYHVFRPGYDPEAQAAYCYRVVGNLSNGDLIPWLDVELPVDPTTVDMFALMQAVAETVLHMEERFGKPVGIYTAAWWWNQLPTAERKHRRWGGLPLWAANYNGTPGSFPLPQNTWAEYRIHQYSSTGHIAGIRGDVDLNYCPDLEKITYTSDKETWKDSALASIVDLREGLAELEAAIRRA